MPARQQRPGLAPVERPRLQRVSEDVAISGAAPAEPVPAADPAPAAQPAAPPQVAAGPAASTLVAAWDLVAAAGLSARDTPAQWVAYNTRLPVELWLAVKSRSLFDAQRTQNWQVAGNWYCQVAYQGITGVDLAVQMATAWRDRMRAIGRDPQTLQQGPAGSKVRRDTRDHLAVLVRRLDLHPTRVPVWMAYSAAVEALLDRLQREHPDPDNVPLWTPQQR